MRRPGEANSVVLAVLVIIVVALSFQYLSRALAYPWSRKDAGQRAGASNESLLEGSRLYLTDCAACHGYDGSGGDYGPSLHKLQAGDPLLKLVIVNGVRGEMPGFGKKLSGGQVRSIIAEVRSWKD